MAWQDFIDTDFIALNVKHASGALSAILAFSVVGWVAEKVMPYGFILKAIHLTEKIVVAACMAYLTFVILWEIGGRIVSHLKGHKKGHKNGTVSTIMAE